MGASKAESFPESQQSMARIAKALGHPARIAIIEQLLSRCDCICNDIVDELPLSQATISQHLRELKESGLINGSIEGNTICYCLDTASLAEFGAYLKGIVASAKSLKKRKVG